MIAPVSSLSTRITADDRAPTISAPPAGHVKSFFQTYYRPRNASLSIAGDFETDSVLAMVTGTSRLLGTDPAGRPRRPAGLPRTPAPHEIAWSSPAVLLLHAPALLPPNGLYLDRVGLLLQRETVAFVRDAVY